MSGQDEDIKVALAAIDKIRKRPMATRGGKCYGNRYGARIEELRLIKRVLKDHLSG